MNVFYVLKKSLCVVDFIVLFNEFLLDVLLKVLSNNRNVFDFDLLCVLLSRDVDILPLILEESIKILFLLWKNLSVKLLNITNNYYILYYICVHLQTSTLIIQKTDKKNCQNDDNHYFITYL